MFCRYRWCRWKIDHWCCWNRRQNLPLVSLTDTGGHNFPEIYLLTECLRSDLQDPSSLYSPPIMRSCVVNFQILAFTYLIYIIWIIFFLFIQSICRLKNCFQRWDFLRYRYLFATDKKTKQVELSLSNILYLKVTLIWEQVQESHIDVLGALIVPPLPVLAGFIVPPLPVSGRFYSSPSSGFWVILQFPLFRFWGALWLPVFRCAEARSGQEQRHLPVRQPAHLLHKNHKLIKRKNGKLRYSLIIWLIFFLFLQTQPSFSPFSPLFA